MPHWLLVVALILAVVRQIEIPGVEPAGYWPRWALVWSLVALRIWPWFGCFRRSGCGHGWDERAGRSGNVGVVCPGRRRHRADVVSPAARPVADGRARQDLHQCDADPARTRDCPPPSPLSRTIINLFPEDTPLHEPALSRRAWSSRESARHPLRRQPIGRCVASDAFLDETLRLARDPSAWPILVHCHGVHGPYSCLDGDLPIRRRGTAAGRDLPRNRAPSRLPAEGFGHPALQSRAAASRRGPLLGRPDRHAPETLCRRHG